MTRVAFVLMFFLTLRVSVCAAEPEQELFEQQLARSWQKVFSDDGLGDWRDHWFLDGIHAKVSNGDKGMTIDTAEGFAVLWTKREFDGDIRIEYDFQRVDSRNKGVNIIYIQARGKGTEGFEQDITKWSGKRKLAAMRNYYNNMDTYHISYAAYGGDYIRGRRYMPLKKRGLGGTQLKGGAMKTGLFITGKWYHVTIIKRQKDLLVEYKGEGRTLVCHLVNTDKPSVTTGRIGLRLMPGRESMFKNFSVSTAK